MVKQKIKELENEIKSLSDKVSKLEKIIETLTKERPTDFLAPNEKKKTEEDVIKEWLNYE